MLLFSWELRKLLFVKKEGTQKDELKQVATHTTIKLIDSERNDVKF